MAYDGWINYNGRELVNLSRTAQLAAALGIETVWTEPSSVQWIEDALGGADYDDITEAPWYDPGFAASAEFAGFVPLSLPGLDDSTLTASSIEYITDGGSSGKPRNSTLPIVVSLAIIASTDRGADYGKRWLDRLLRGGAHETRAFCAGAELSYFRSRQQEGEPVPSIAHRRDVSTTRGTSVTRKRSADCSTTWWVTYTWTANDPFEYSEPVEAVTIMGAGPTATGPLVVDSGSSVLIEQSCPAYDYTPIYDPLYPALVAAPTVPDFYPNGWNLEDGMTFERFWANLTPVEPVSLNVVPVITLSSATAARMVRVSVWSSLSGPSEQCDPLFSVIVTYLPPVLEFTIDGEQQASYVWDGASPVVRRADSLVYGPNAIPVQWTSFNDYEALYVTLDLFADSGDYEGSGDVRLSLSFVQKSD